jgi:hypothetical protein
MHQVTIHHERNSVSITDHANFGEAHQALLKYVVNADYYLRAAQSTRAHTRYELLRLAGLDDPAPARRPHVTGIATIKELPHLEAS